MATVIIRHEVADYARWKPHFDDHESARRDAGFTSHTLHRDADNPSMIEIVFRCDDLDRAREFARSDSLREAMKRGGVKGTPQITFCEDLEAIRYEAPERQAHPMQH